MSFPLCTFERLIIAKRCIPLILDKVTRTNRRVMRGRLNRVTFGGGEHGSTAQFTCLYITLNKKAVFFNNIH